MKYLINRKEVIPMGRPEYVEIFNDTMRLCGEDDELAESVKKSLAKQYFLPETEQLVLQGKPKDKPARVVVSPKRTFEAAEQYKDKKVCVLNFASSKNPGGGVVRGASAQEECLCRVSTLYPCLADKKIVDSFYRPHRTMFHDTLYNSDLIFTPAVTVF
ncbi:MAG: TIGR02452 family protein, partial [Ruminococcus sp.]|nr:TIGR02452 family protein [Ruminococcus sp.]